jgi:glycosyltransferase involved in cell wall biosynthesis
LLRGERFDLAILTHWFWNAISIPEHYVEEIRRHSPSTFVAVLTDDQHGLREKQMADITHRWNDYERVADFTAREMEVYRRADCVLTISDDDARAFRLIEPALRTARMPMIAEIAPEGPTFEERSGLIFLANFDNPANSDAATWFLSEIWPRVRRELPDVDLALVGNGLPDDPRFHGPGIVRVGFAPNLAPEFAKRRVAVSPVRFGTGIKTKNLLALAHAVPLVTTKVGADGMNLVQGDSALIADAAEDFASAVIRAHSNGPLWLRLSTLGKDHIAAEFSAARMARAVSELCEMARTVSPHRYEPDFSWSFRRVEIETPECLTAQPAQRRPSVRVEAYVNYAARLFAEGKHAETLVQLRHFFGLLRGSVKATSLTIRAMELAARCYRALGDDVKASDYEERVRQSCAFDNEWRASTKKQRTRASGRSAAPPQFSVILPTYNRANILRECLEALERQTLAPENFEVIVVDDGSSDATGAICRDYQSTLALQYLRQTNAGAGAARRRGVQHSRGKFLLFINDDTIASPDLLTVHAATHERHAEERQAVLGDFRFPEAANSRALTRFLSRSPFLFPQGTLAPGVHWDYSKFVTCNASVRRDAVVGVGSFDPEFRIAEDSELGLRLSRRGYFVRYVPEARATHQHFPFTVADLVRRAKAYGEVQIRFLRTHPGLLGDGTTSYGWLDRKFADEWRARLEPQQKEIREAEEAITKFDAIDFAEFERASANGEALAADVMKMFRRVVPEVYWHHFYSSAVRAWDEEQHNALAHTGSKVATTVRDVYL